MPDRGLLPQTDRHPQTSANTVMKRQTRVSVVNTGNQFLILRNLVWAVFCRDVHFSGSSMAKHLSASVGSYMRLERKKIAKSIAECTYKSLVSGRGCQSLPFFLPHCPSASCGSNLTSSTRYSDSSYHSSEHEHSGQQWSPRACTSTFLNSHSLSSLPT